MQFAEAAGRPLAEQKLRRPARMQVWRLRGPVGDIRQVQIGGQGFDAFTLLIGAIAVAGYAFSQWRTRVARIRCTDDPAEVVQFVVSHYDARVAEGSA